ncbi:MAG TPA: DoxX family protein [Actinomycetota bacterium]|nr:DoxX family protein [Actinomycetota bacterium]
MDLRRALPRPFYQTATGAGAEARPTALDEGMLLLRIVVGLTMAAHGTQKLFGWLGGPGFSGTANFLGGMGFRPGALHAALSGGSELGGGLLLAFGLLTPLGAAAVTGSMLAAIATVTWQNGFISAKGGYELSAVLIGGALAIAWVGPGQFSLDRILGLELSGRRWGLAAAVLGAVTAAGVLAFRQ